MSDRDAPIDPDEIDPINVTPKTPMKAGTDLDKALDESSGRPPATDQESSPGLGRDVPDLSDVDDVFDGPSEPPSPGEMAKRVEQMTRMEVFDYVLRSGPLYFEDGHELISCPAYNTDAVCALRPTQHEITDKSIMVCTGPVTKAKHRNPIFGESTTSFGAAKVHSDCPHHPDTRRTLPEGLKELAELRQKDRSAIDDRLKEEYSR